MALSGTSDAQPGDQKTLVEIIEELDRDNERLRTKVLEIMTLMEEAVTAQVAAELRVVELESDLHAIQATKTMRLLRPFRNGYAWLRVVVVAEQYPIFVPVHDRV